MANEAVIVELLGNGGDPVEYTVADGTGIAKGTIMRIADARTMVVAGANEVPVGIAAAEKVANDGSTTLAVYTNGIFDLKVTDSTGAVSVGEYVITNGSNTVTRLPVSGLEPDDINKIVGKALETGSAGEVIQVRVNL